MKWCVSSLLFICLIVSVNAKTWYVTVDCITDTITNGDSENIDVAFTEAICGDTIIIDSGIYYYSVQNTVDTTDFCFLRLEDSGITIIGNGDVVIDGEYSCVILFAVNKDSVSIENIKFQRGYDYTEGDKNQYAVAIDLYESDSWIIRNCYFYDNVVADSLVDGNTIKDVVLHLERWSKVENCVFDSNVAYAYGYSDYIMGLIHCDYEVDFIGNEFKNNKIFNFSEESKELRGLVYYDRAVNPSYWYDNTFVDNVMLNYNALSGAVSILYQNDYNGITDKVYGDSNIVLNCYYYDKLTHNIDDTDILVVPSLNKVNWLAIDIYANPEKDFKLLWLAIDLYDLFPYIQEILEKTEQRNYLNHTLIRRRFR